MSSIIKAHILGWTTCAELAVSAVQTELPLDPPPSAAPQRLPRSKRHALDTVRKARQQAAALLAAAQAEAERIKEQARAEGYAEGLKSGHEQGLREGAAEGVAVGWGKGIEKAQEAVRAAQDMLAAAEDERGRALADMEGQIMELALTIAAKIVHKEIELDEMYLARLIDHALKQAIAVGRVTARVRPGNAEQLARAEAMAQELAGNLQVVVDESLSQGDCVIETEAGILDGRLESRMNSIREALERAVE